MYIELHARSAFSFLEGSSLPEDLARICARLNMPAMALLDTDGVYGAPRFHLTAEKSGIKAHIGAEVTCTPLDSVILSGACASQSEAHAESKDPYAQRAVKGTGMSALFGMIKWFGAARFLVFHFSFPPLLAIKISAASSPK
jgi:DNA polymerase III alpha subunit (gram-positive type)